MTDKAKKLAILYNKINRLPVLSDEEVEIIKELIGRELFKEVPSPSSSKEGIKQAIGGLKNDR